MVQRMLLKVSFLLENATTELTEATGKQNYEKQANTKSAIVVTVFPLTLCWGCLVFRLTSTNTMPGNLLAIRISWLEGKSLLDTGMEMTVLFLSSCSITGFIRMLLVACTPTGLPLSQNLDFTTIRRHAVHI